MKSMKMWPKVVIYINVFQEDYPLTFHAWSTHHFIFCDFTVFYENY